MIYSLTVTNSIGESMTFELAEPMRSGHAVRLIDGVGTPDMNVNSTPYGIGDGSALGSIKAEYRLITISLWPLKYPTVETSRQRLYRFFQIKKPIVLTFVTENRTVWINGYVQSIAPNIFENPETIDIEVKCLYPYFRKMNDDQTGFYGIQPEFEFIFSCEYEYTDGCSWYFDDIVNPLQWRDFSYGNDIYIGIGDGVDHKMALSYGGFSWEGIDTIFPKNGHWSTIANGDGHFVALLYDSSIGLYTSDGQDWQIVGLPFNGLWSKIIFGEDRFVALTEKGLKGAYSLNGIDWHEMDMGIEAVWTSAAYGNGYFVALEKDSHIGVYSENGIDWTPIAFPELGKWYEVVFGNGVFLFTRNENGNWARTADPSRVRVVNQPTIEYPLKIGFSGSQFIAIKENSDYGFCSVDGVRWFPINIPFVDDWVCLKEGNNDLTMMSSIGNVLMSRQGIEYVDPIEFSYYTIDNRMTIDYQGEIDAGIKITIECQDVPGDIMIYNVDTLEYIKIFTDRIKLVTGGELTIKDIIEISTDSGNKYIRLLRDGVYYNILGAMDRGMTWFILKQGPNVFTYTTSNEHAAIIMTFSYNDAYAAI